MKSIVCWGELLWDLYPDRSILGGAAGNVAYHLQVLGDSALLVSRIGTDPLGDAALAGLRSAGLDPRLVQRDPGRPTGTVYVSLHEGEPSFTIGSEAAWDGIEYDPPTREAVRAADLVVYGTLAQRSPLGFGALGQALVDLPGHAVKVCDLNVRPPFASREVVDTALERADVVKLNEAEARRVSELFHTASPIDWLLERGVSLVALTLGRSGSRLTTRNAYAAHPGVPIPAGTGDPVGAGDAFTAVLCHHMAHARNATRLDLERLSAAANRYAAFVASQPGATPPIPAEVVSAARVP